MGSTGAAPPGDALGPFLFRDQSSPASLRHSNDAVAHQGFIFRNFSAFICQLESVSTGPHAPTRLTKRWPDWLRHVPSRRTRRIEGREWWLWGFAVTVTLVLTLGIASLTFPWMRLNVDRTYWLDLREWVRALAALVLLFDIYTVYQH